MIIRVNLEGIGAIPWPFLYTQSKPGIFSFEFQQENNMVWDFFIYLSQNRHIKCNAISFTSNISISVTLITSFKVYCSGSDFISPVHRLNLVNKNSPECRSYIYIFVKIFALEYVY